MTIVHDPEDARIRYRQIPALLEAGHRVIYAAPFAPFGRQPPPGVASIELPRAVGRRRHRAVLAARKVMARARDEVDVVLFHDPDLLLALPGLVGKSPPLIWDVHEDTAAALSMRQWVPRAFRPLLSWVVRLAERWAESRMTIILAENGYRERFSDDHAVVPNSVWVPDTFAVTAEPTRVVYLGKVTAARGGHELIEVARQLPELEVEILGPADDTMSREMTAAHEEGVLHWAGFVPNREALARLEGAMAGLALLHDEPNYAHSAPTKVMEYMAHGVPVISTPNHVSREMVESADAGAIVPFGDVSAVVEVLRQWAAEPQRRRVLATSGHEYVSEHFNWGRDRIAFVGQVESAGGR